MKPLAILGGTFDPVHRGHLRVARDAARILDAEVRLMPAAIPPHRPPPVASADERVALLRAALRDCDDLTLDVRELRRSGPSWSVDTLRQLREEQGTRPLVLLVGADAFAGLPGWHRWHELFDLAHIGVLARPDMDTPWPDALAREVASRRVPAPEVLHASPAGGIAMLAVTPIVISASAIRAELAAGRDPHGLLPDSLFADPALLAPYRVPHP